MARPELTEAQWWMLNSIVNTEHRGGRSFSIADLGVLALEGCLKFHSGGFNASARGRCWMERWRKEQVQLAVTRITQEQI